MHGKCMMAFTYQMSRELLPLVKTTTTTISTLAIVIVVSLTCIITSLALAQWLTWVVARASGRLPPGPFPLPILGNLLHLITSPTPHRSLQHLSRLYGPVFFLRLGSSPTIVVSTAEAARHIFQAHDKSFAGRPPSQVWARLFYGGDKAAFTTSYGPVWRSARQLYATTHALGPTPRLAHSPLLHHHTRCLLRRLRDAAAAASGSPVNLTACLSTLVENIMCHLLLRQSAADVVMVPNGGGGGHRKKNEKKKIQKKAEGGGGGGGGGGPNLAQLVQEGNFLLGANLIGDSIPLLGFLDYSSKRAMDRWLSSVDAILDALLSNRAAAAAAAKAEADSDSDDEGDDEGLKSPTHILDVFLAAHPPLSRDRIKAMTLELIMAGINASTVTLDWAMAEILSNPRVLEKLQEESECVVGKGRMVEMADLPNLPYMKAVVKETLRKHTPGPFLIPHMSTQACTLQLDHDGVQCEYEIPSGTRMLVNAWAIANDPSVWKEPSKFLPERFITEPDIDVYGRHYQLLPFGSGRRMCPGIGLAMGMVELGVANLTHCFDWSVHGHDAAVDMSEKLGLSLPRIAPLLAVPKTFRLTNEI